MLAVHQFPPLANGGTEQLTLWTAQALRRAGHDVRIVASVPRTATLDDLARIPRSYLFDGMAVDLIERPREVPQKQTRARLEYDDPRAGELFAQLLVAERPDVVHFLHLAGLTVSALEAAQRARVATLFTATDFWFECPLLQLLLPDGTDCPGPAEHRGNCLRHFAELRRPALAALRAVRVLDWTTERSAGAVARVATLVPHAAPAIHDFQTRSQRVRAALQSTARVIAPTRLMETRLRAFGIDSGRSTYLPYGVPMAAATGSDVRPGHDAQRPMRVAYVGALGVHKGLPILLEAVRRVPSRRLQVEIYGSAPDRLVSRVLDAALRSDSRIRNPGTLAPEAFRTLLRDIDVLVVPSMWRENAPLVAVQAAAASCPMIVSDVPGLAEIVRDGENGWVFRRGDAQQLAMRIEALLEDAQALQRVRRRAPVVMSIEEHAGVLGKLYEAARDAPSAA